MYSFWSWTKNNILLDFLLQQFKGQGKNHFRAKSDSSKTGVKQIKELTKEKKKKSHHEG